MYNEEDLADIRKVREEWEAETHDPAVEAQDERKDRFATVSNLSISEFDRFYQRNG